MNSNTIISKVFYEIIIGKLKTSDYFTSSKPTILTHKIEIYQKVSEQKWFLHNQSLAAYIYIQHRISAKFD